jgi:hypothetical protein
MSGFLSSGAVCRAWTPGILIEEFVGGVRMPDKWPMDIFTVAHHDLGGMKTRLNKTKVWSGSLVVPQGMDARTVSTITKMNRLKVILVVDGGGNVTGAVDPKAVVTRARREIPGVKDFDEAVEVLKKKFPQRKGFESLNGVRPDWHWCSAGNHLTTEDPCSEHENQL